MCCIFALLFLFGPRVAMFVWWLFDPLRIASVFSTFWVPLLGFIFLPWTTMAYVLVSPGGVSDFDWVWLLLALLIDLGSYGGGAYARKR